MNRFLCFFVEFIGLDFAGIFRFPDFVGLSPFVDLSS